jgi:PhnB protein
MATREHARRDEAEIRARIESWAKALRAKDLDRLMSFYAPDFVAFDLPPPLRVEGAGAHRDGLEAWFRTWQGPIGLDMEELAVTVGDGVAFSRGLNHLHGKRADGSDTDVWVRATVGFRKIDGEWIVVHEHVSVPFYMDGSYKAAVDLTP